MSREHCLQCGAELVLKAVPADEHYPFAAQVGACAACGSRAYMMPGGKMMELKTACDELLSAAKNAALDLVGTPDGDALDRAIAKAEGRA